MCQRNGIYCYLTSTCKKLCGAASRWANQDYVDRTELQFSNDKLELIAAKQIVSRADAVSPGITAKMESALESLTPKQREAIEVVFYDEDGRQSYRKAAKRLGITRNAAHRRVRNALNLLETMVGHPTNSRGITLQGRGNGI